MHSLRSPANGMNHTCFLLPSQSWSSFTDPRRMEGWVGLGGWLHTEINVRHRELNPDTVTHPSTTWARCRLTSLIKTNALPLHQTTTPSSPLLIVRRTRLSTVGDRAFPVAACRVWNDLPQHVSAAESLPVFCSRLKTHLFRRCFPWHPYCCHAREVTVSFRTR